MFAVDRASEPFNMHQTTMLAPFEALGAATAARGALSGPLRRCLALIAARSQEDVSLDEMAGAARWSKFHLVRSFKSAIGVSPCTYLMHARVASASRLLAEGATPIYVAAHCGFADQSHLNRWFKKVMNTTPGAYARLHRPPLATTRTGSTPSSARIHSCESTRRRVSFMQALR